MTGQELFQLLTIVIFISTIIITNISRFNINLFEADTIIDIIVTILFTVSLIGTIFITFIFFHDNWNNIII